MTQPPAFNLPIGSRSANLQVSGPDGQILTISTTQRRLSVAGQPVGLGARAFDLLVVLARHAGQVLSRAELLDQVWPGQDVEENNLAVQVNALRKVLGRDMVSTVPGRGYCLVALPDLPGGPEAAAPTIAAAASTLPVLPPLRTNLPAMPPELTGRDADLAALDRLVDQQRLVTVVGATGIGKSCVARAVLHARRSLYRHGVCLVELATLRDGAALAGTVAAALGLPQPADGVSVPALVRHLAPLSLLLALDNAEHLATEVSALASALLAAAPGVHLLVTSQIPLKLAAEQLHVLPALALPAEGADLAAAAASPALRLFTLRAQSQDARFRLGPDNLAQVLQLCRQLDGSPLAIELAAARLRQLGLAALVQGLDQRFRLLTSRRLDLPDRQQSLLAALDWSHGLLSADEQAVFRRLTVFVGSFSLDAALALLTQAQPHALDEGAALDALFVLVERSLVELLPATAQAPDRPRYRLLATPLAYGRDQLRQADEAGAMQAAHAQAMRAQFAAVGAQLLGGALRFDLWRAATEPDIDDGLAAVRWALVHDPTCAIAIASVLSRAMLGRRHADCKALWLAVEPVLDAAMAQADTAPGGAVNEAPAADLLTLGRAAFECGKFWANTRSALATQRCQQAVQLARRSADRLTEFMALGELAWACGTRGDLAGLQAVKAQRDLLFDPTWPAYVEAASFDFEMWLPELQGDGDAVIACLARQAQRSGAAGTGVETYLANMGAALLSAGRHDEARAHAQARAERAADLRFPAPLRHDMNNLVRACVALGLAGPAREALQLFWPLAQRHDMQARWADGAAAQARLAGRPRVALALLGHADAGFARAGTARQPSEQQLVDSVAVQATAVAGEPAATQARQLGHDAQWPDAALYRLAMDDSDDLSAQRLWSPN